MSKKILIIDDDPTSNTLVKFLLNSNNYQAIEAMNGEEGIVKAKNEHPDLIVLDIEMPKMDGYTFLVELKSSEISPTPGVIMLTTKDEMQDIFKMEGVIDYFVKPLNSEKLLATIKEYFGEKDEEQS